MRRLPKIYFNNICHQNESGKTCPAQRQAFFCFVFFVATKKMTLLSGNPDGSDFGGFYIYDNCNKPEPAGRVQPVLILYDFIFLRYIQRSKAKPAVRALPDAIACNGDT